MFIWMFYIMMAIIAVATFMDSGAFVSVGVIGLLCSLILLYGFSTVMTFTMSHIALIVIGFILYFAVGSTWSVFMWWKFNRYIREKFIKFKEKNPLLSGDKLKQEFLTRVPGSGVSMPPMASNYKSDISFWIITWPFSIIKYLVGDFIISVANWIIKNLGNVYSKISYSTFKDL